MRLNDATVARCILEWQNRRSQDVTTFLDVAEHPISNCHHIALLLSCTSRSLSDWPNRHFLRHADSLRLLMIGP